MECGGAFTLSHEGPPLSPREARFAVSRHHPPLNDDRQDYQPARI